MAALYLHRKSAHCAAGLRRMIIRAVFALHPRGAVQAQHLPVPPRHVGSPARAMHAGRGPPRCSGRDLMWKAHAQGLLSWPHAGLQWLLPHMLLPAAQQHAHSSPV